MIWVRGDSLGTGSFATVNIAIPTNTSIHFPSPTAVKSSDVHSSSMLKNEKEILDCLGASPYVKRHGGRLPESYVRRCTRSIVEGLKHIHDNGYVHCDVKLQNILVFENGDVKIADFGLAKEKGEKQGTFECRGTPLFMSPESVNDNEYESPADIWALGCAVVEMLTGKPAWDVRGSNIWSLLIRIGVGEELPKIPEELSEEGKDFLLKCFVKDPMKRWSAEMLLHHPFVNNETVSFHKVNEPLPLPSPSPRTHFDLTHWASTVTTWLPSSPDSDEWRMAEFGSSCSPENRFRRLLTDQTPANWSESDGWTSVR
ncbi:Mitogen-activated protein kinase kinase kinase 17 [Glycine soja]|uniref:Mitogen-activated protein kinase kinase kinase 17 n=1 Tax=Glycine soja TaxID=3848 RepID=A0A445LYP6_GLYSO|nr:Mitogen-activated protein kinase kinase kinase 17 [Glycine soja]